MQRKLAVLAIGLAIVFSLYSRFVVEPKVVYACHIEGRFVVLQPTDKDAGAWDIPGYYLPCENCQCK